MSKLELVDELFGDVPYMSRAQAETIRDIIETEAARDVIEVGFYQGKSTAYIAGILEDRGEGSVSTFDLRTAQRHTPNVETILEKTGLQQRVTVYYCKRSYTWELQRLINAPERPQFDFCYFDGGHTWDLTGFGILLIDMLLRPGGTILLDDMNWSMARSPHYRRNPKLKRRFDDDEVEAQPVRLAWETVLKHLGYQHIREYKEERWGLARKPL